MHAVKSSAVLITFLGKTDYKDTSYRYPDDYTVDCQYGAAAFLTYLRNYEDVSPDCLIICGTPSSYWYRLPSYFAETAEMFGDVGASGDAAPAVIRERLLALSEGEAASGLKDIANSEGSVLEEEFASLLRSFETSISGILEPAGLTVKLLRHAEDFSSYDRQIELLQAIRASEILTEGTRVYLDITFGLRIMPFMVFASFQSLCYTKGLKISRICYSPEPMSRAESSERLSFIEEVRNRLRFLKSHDPDLYGKKLEEIKALLKSLKNASAAPSDSQGRRRSKVCFLDTGGILQDAALAARFRASLNTQVFEPVLESDGGSGGNSWSPQDRKKLRELSYRLNVCDYRVIPELENFIDRMKKHIPGKELADLVGKSFDWTREYIAGKNPDDCARAIKKFSFRYLEAGDYLHAVSSCYYAINRIEFSGLQDYDQKDLLSRKLGERYGDAYTEVFMEQLRPMVAHLNDKTLALDDDKAFVHKMITVNDDNMIRSENLRQYFRKCFKKLGSAPDTADVPAPESRRHVMFSFIGAGDYGHASYRYCDPFHPDNHDFDLKNSSVAGLSLAARLNSLPASQDASSDQNGNITKKPGLNRFVICGTRTSNWIVVLGSLEEEFVIPACTSGKNDSGEVLAAFRALKDEVSESFSRPENAKGEISSDLLDRLNSFFRNNRKVLGPEIILAATHDSISEPETQSSIVRVLADNVGTRDLVSLDITHSYRIIPIISICALLYLTAVRQVRVKHIFYGSVPMEPDFIPLNGLKQFQMPDEEVFARAREEIYAILGADTGSENLSGTVYDMRNLHKLVEYSSAINQYNATGNPEFLQSLIKIEFRKKDPESYVDFINGVILSNISMFRAGAEFLNPVLSKLEQGISDPLLNTLKSDLIESLYWVRELCSDNYDFLPRLLVRKAKTALDNNNFMYCYLACYECMQLMAKKELIFIKNSYGNGRLVIRKDRFEASAKFPSEKLSLISGINNAAAKSGRKSAGGNDAQLSVRDIVASKQNNTVMSKALSLIGRVIFGRQDWDFIKNLRNRCFHTLNKGDMIPEDPAKLIPDIHRILGCINGMLSE